MTNFTDAVRLLAAPLSTGDTLRTVCPSCDGGRTREKSFVLTKAEEGVLYHCFRASCEFSGGLGVKSGEIVRTITDQKRNELSVQKVPTYFSLGQHVPALRLRPLADVEMEMLLVKFGAYALLMGIAYDETTLRYRIPITRPDGTAKGFVLRTWDNSRTPKALTYLYDYGYTKVAYYTSGWVRSGRPFFVVEDQFSARRLHERFPAAALLGTHVPDGGVPELMSAVKDYSNGTVVFALDADAARQGVELMRKYKTVFDNTAAMVLTKDVKDMSDDEFDKAFGGWL